MGNQQNLSPRVAERVFEAVFPSYGALTQLGEYLLCKQAVMGSIPIGSTLSLHCTKAVPLFRNQDMMVQIRLKALDMVS